jgi:hypothetical protein
MLVNLFTVFQQWAADISSISRLFLVTIGGAVCSVMVRYTLEQRVFLNDTYVKYGSDRKYRRQLRRKFRDEWVPSRKIIHNLISTLRTTGLLIDRKQTRKCRVLTEKKLDDMRATLEHTPRKLLKRQTQKTIMSV